MSDVPPGGPYSREFEAGMQEMVCQCIYSKLKKVILDAVGDKLSKRVINIIQSIPECDSPQGVAALENMMAQQGDGKPHRKRSAYQQHISECMQKHSSEIKGKPFGSAQGPMKVCVAEWNQKKKEGGK